MSETQRSSSSLLGRRGVGVGAAAMMVVPPSPEQASEVVEILEEEDQPQQQQQQSALAETKPPTIVIYFVRLGVAMPQVRIDKLKTLAEKLGATCIQKFHCPQPKKRRRIIWGPEDSNGKAAAATANDESNPIIPTHVVVEESCSPKRIAKHLLFQSKEQMELFFNTHNIQCAIPEWITRAASSLTKELPSNLPRHHRWLKVQYNPKKKTSNTTTKTTTKTKKRTATDAAATSTVAINSRAAAAPSSFSSPSSSRRHPLQQQQQQQQQTKKENSPPTSHSHHQSQSQQTTSYRPTKVVETTTFSQQPQLSQLTQTQSFPRPQSQIYHSQQTHMENSPQSQQTNSNDNNNNSPKGGGEHVFPNYSQLSQLTQTQSFPQSQQSYTQSLALQRQQSRDYDDYNSEDDDEDDVNNKLNRLVPGTKRYSMNIKIAEQLQKLGKLHQKCPLVAEDMWKSYSLDKAAGRVRNLPFEITLSKESQNKLAQVWGIGQSTRLKIKEVLETGTIARIHEFQRDPQRMAMKNLIGIWGIGRSTAYRLIQHGFHSIDDVRNRFDEVDELVGLSRNQKIGIDCYEDFLEEMSRSEVEAIGERIRQAIYRQFPLPADQRKLEITIMGSYRRGKESCGDVDVLITHSDYIDRVPPQVLGEVVEDLLDNGDMEFHLTFISGMQIRSGKTCHPGGYNDSDHQNGIHKHPKPDRETGSSYMGVFKSPVVPGKRRRVDIKFYPHRERAFAWIYFTGNGFFNRSIRLYATRMKGGLQMNDKGLFTRGHDQHNNNNKVRVMEAETEKDVFDWLGLVYREPHERDSYDAVITSSGDVVDFDHEGTTDGEEQKFLREEGDHKWID